MNWKNLLFCCSVTFMTTNVALCSPLLCDSNLQKGTYQGYLTNIIMRKEWKMTYLFVSDDNEQGCVQFRNYNDRPFTEAIKDAFLAELHVDIIVGDDHEIEGISYNSNE